MSIVTRAFTYSALGVLGMGILVAGCGKPSGGGGATGAASTTSGPAPKGGSCMEDKVGVCHEFAENPLGMAEGLCKDLLKGTFKKEACPTADLLGTCKEKDGDKKMYYFGNAQASWVSDAKEECEKNPLKQGSVFTAAPGAEEAAKEKAIPAANKIVGSCTDPDGTQCEDHFGDMVDLDKKLCEDMKQKWSSTPCATDEVVGSCLSRGKVTRYFKKMTKITKASALQGLCESGSISASHWYPSPGAATADGNAKSGGGAKPAAPAAAKAKK